MKSKREKKTMKNNALKKLNNRTKRGWARGGTVKGT